MLTYQSFQNYSDSFMIPFEAQLFCVWMQLADEITHVQLNNFSFKYSGFSILK